ncbi:MAG: hypothetical protein ACTSUP_07945 [Candidatus Heimdallarchaeaceae archaeon]
MNMKRNFRDLVFLIWLFAGALFVMGGNLCGSIFCGLYVAGSLIGFSIEILKGGE